MKISVRVTKHERHLTLGNKQGVVEREVGGGWGDWVMGTEGGIGWDEHWVLYVGKSNSNKKYTYKNMSRVGL